MDNIERFVTEHNVSRYFVLLDGEEDASRRAVLSDILLEEENRYCQLAGRLDQLEIYIAKCDFHIGRSQSLLDGADDAATLLLRRCAQNMREIRTALQSVHAICNEGLDRLSGP